MRKTTLAAAACAAAALSLVACSSDDIPGGEFHTLETYLKDQKSPAKVDLAEIYPDSDIYLVCPYGGEAANAKIGELVFSGEDVRDDTNFVIAKQRDSMFESSSTKTPINRGEIDLCSSENSTDARLIDNTTLTFEKDEDGTWVLKD